LPEQLHREASNKAISIITRSTHHTVAALEPETVACEPETVNRKGLHKKLRSFKNWR
jgi:hypothetical protein